MRARVCFALATATVTLGVIAACSTFDQGGESPSTTDANAADDGNSASDAGSDVHDAPSSPSDAGVDADAFVAPRFCETLDAGDATVSLCDDFDKQATPPTPNFIPPWSDFIVQQDAGLGLGPGLTSQPFAFVTYAGTTELVAEGARAQLGFTGQWPTSSSIGNVDVSFDVRLDALAEDDPMPIARLCFLRITYGINPTERVSLCFNRNNNETAIEGYAFIENDSNYPFTAAVVYALNQPRHITFTLDRTNTRFVVSDHEVVLFQHSLGAGFSTAYRVELGLLVNDAKTSGQVSFDNVVISTH